MEHDRLDSLVRLGVYRAVIERGRAPSLDELGASAVLDQAAIRASLQRLAQGRALILSRNQDRIDVAPPFSLVPTTFRVETPAGAWWGNCAWESLGIAALLGTGAVIRTSYGALGEALEVHVRGGRVEPHALRMHIPLPAARWWDDVGFTCSTILFFRDDAEVDRWSARSGLPRGETLSADQAWRLAEAWFTGRLEPDWRRLSPEEAERSFAEVGLSGPFWKLR